MHLDYIPIHLSVKKVSKSDKPVICS